MTLVVAALPRLGERERTALALVGVAGTARPPVAKRLGIGEEELAESLARARKELRRTLAPLPGSGWCERSERLISDRIDGPLEQRDAARLDVHLRNCPRCVEHERRLVQATDALIAGAAPQPSGPVLAPAREGAPQSRAGEPAPGEPPPGEPAPGEPAPGEPAASREPAPHEPAAPHPIAPRAAAPGDPLPAQRSVLQRTSALGWNVLIVFAIVLALAALALALAGALGAEL